MHINDNEITRIVELMAKHDLTEIEIKGEDHSLTIKRQHVDSNPPAQIKPHIPEISSSVHEHSIANPPSLSKTDPVSSRTIHEVKEVISSAETINAPLVGIFYTAIDPKANPFVKIGDSVDEESVVCIVEAMKVMNEIKAGKKGIIREILAKNAAPVEFDQPLFKINCD